MADWKRSAEPLNGGVGLPSRFEEIVDTQSRVLHRQFGVIGTAGAARVAEHQRALGVVHERPGLGKVGRGGAVLDHEPVDGDAVAGLADDTTGAARHFRHGIGAEMLDELVERAGNRRQAGQLGDQLIAAGDRFAAFDRLAVARDRPRRQVALRIRERLVELHREGMGEVVEDIFAWRDVDAHVIPFLGRKLRQPPLHQRLAGGHDLDDGGVAFLQVAGDRPDQRRGLHRREQMAEEPLLGGLEGAARRRLRLLVQGARGAGDVRRLHGGIEIVMDDRECPCICVVDADLLGRQFVLDQLVFYAGKGERAGGVEAERAQIAGQHLHRGDAAALDRLDELGAGAEREILAAP